MEIGDTPFGRQSVIPIADGRVTGPVLMGDVLAGGADWRTMHDDGKVTIDTRATVRLVDGTFVSLSLRGVRTAGDLAGGESFRCAATATSKSCTYAWLDASVLVAVASSWSDSVQFDVYRLA